MKRYAVHVDRPLLSLFPRRESPKSRERRVIRCTKPGLRRPGELAVGRTPALLFNRLGILWGDLNPASREGREKPPPRGNHPRNNRSPGETVEIKKRERGKREIVKHLLNRVLGRSGYQKKRKKI